MPHTIGATQWSHSRTLRILASLRRHYTRTATAHIDAAAALALGTTSTDGHTYSTHLDAVTHAQAMADHLANPHLNRFFVTRAHSALAWHHAATEATCPADTATTSPLPTHGIVVLAEALPIPVAAHRPDVKVTGINLITWAPAPNDPTATTITAVACLRAPALTPHGEQLLFHEVTSFTHNLSNPTPQLPTHTALWEWLNTWWAHLTTPTLTWRDPVRINNQGTVITTTDLKHDPKLAQISTIVEWIDVRRDEDGTPTAHVPTPAQTSPDVPGHWRLTVHGADKTEPRLVWIERNPMPRHKHTPTPQRRPRTTLTPTPTPGCRTHTPPMRHLTKPPNRRPTNPAPQHEKTKGSR